MSSFTSYNNNNNSNSNNNDGDDDDDVIFIDYNDESMLSEIQTLVSRDLSEPYSIFTYRYFLHSWPQLCICAYAKDKNGDNGRGPMIATIICRADPSGNDSYKGYIAMLTVDKPYRKKGIGIKLAHKGIERMIEVGCEEITLEAEASNTGALILYEKLGFMRDEKLSRYYLNGSDAYRLKLWVDKKHEVC